MTNGSIWVPSGTMMSDTWDEKSAFHPLPTHPSSENGCVQLTGLLEDPRPVLCAGGGGT